MSQLKNNIGQITSDAEHIAKDYKKLVTIKIAEKLSLFIGILFAAVLIAILVLIVILILSIALSGFLNDILSSKYWGYLIVAGLYILAISLLIIKAFRSEAPLFSNTLVRIILFFLDSEWKQPRTLKGLQIEKENVTEKIELNKDKLKSDFQLLKYSLLDNLLKEFLGLFSRKKASTKTDPVHTKSKKRGKKKVEKTKP